MRLVRAKTRRSGMMSLNRFEQRADSAPVGAIRKAVDKGTGGASRAASDVE